MLMAEVGKAKDLLRKIRSGAQYGNIQLKDVKAALTDEALLSADGLLTANDNGSTLLHLAAQTKVAAVLPLVTDEYKRLKVFADAMLRLNNKNMNPLHVAIATSRYENVVLLFNECIDLCPESLQPNRDGWTLMHSAVQSPENLNIVKYLLSHDICKPMLLLLGRSSQQQSSPLLPLDLAKEQLAKNESYMRKAEKSSSRDAYSVNVDPKKKLVEKCKELVSVVEQPTVELKAEEAKRHAEELAQKKLLEVTEKTRGELQELLLAANWDALINRYWLSQRQEIQKITVRFLGDRHTIDALSDTQLPLLSTNTLQVLSLFLDLEGDDATVKGALKLLRELSSLKESNSFILEHKVTDKVVYLLSSLDAEMQQLCAAILLNVSNQRPDNFDNPTEDSGLVQTLLLVKHFSQDEEARRLASEVLVSLGVKRKQPDPGSWTVRHVSYWIESNMDLDQRAEFSKSFREADIDGLHLLELTSAEMTGLGVKFVSHQRKIASLIDGLRRMNMRSIVGHKDVFLSYAHINIKFARRIKSLLNGANYTIWIDEAGIRAGHKWRNEIADGIQGCSVFLFIMTPRSANSMYCQDEIALAEEYHKPIMTVRLEAVSEMDPGLKLIIQRRQWIDFMDESLFESNKLKLIEAVTTTMGPGSGPDDTDKTEDTQHKYDQPPEYPDGTTKVSDSIQSDDEGATETSEAISKRFLEEELGKVRTEFKGEIQQLQGQVERLCALVEELTGRMAEVERNQSKDRNYYA